MAVLASDIMRKAGIVLQDEDHVRWPLAELADWIHDAGAAIVMARPSTSTKVIILSLIAGTAQAVPTGSAPFVQALISLTRNIRQESPTVLAGLAITPTTRVMLEARDPYWHDETKLPRKKEVRQFFVDEQDPLRFWVYPGNDGTGKAEAVVAVLPAPLTATGDPALIESWGIELAFKDALATPVLDYVLYRCFSKEDVAANAAKADIHFRAFASAIGIDAAAVLQATPNTRRNG